MPLILAIVIGLILFVVLLKLVFAILGLVIALAAAVFIYFVAEKLVGKGA
jgi:hypothetical protein